MTLIDKAEALRVAQEASDNSDSPQDVVAAIAALPARGVGEPEQRKFYHAEWSLSQLLEARDLRSGLLTDDGEAWRYSHTHMDARGKYDVLYRPTRILAALSPAPAPTGAAHVNETPISEHDGADVLTAAHAREAHLREAAAAVRARYMGDNNREDQEVLRCEAAILAMIGEAK